MAESFDDTVVCDVSKMHGIIYVHGVSLMLGIVMVHGDTVLVLTINTVACGVNGDE